MNIFADIRFIYAGSLVVLSLVILFIYSERKRKKRISLLVAGKLNKDLILGFSPLKQNLKFCVLILCCILIFVGLARPQWGMQKRQSLPSGIDILFAVDVSKSMLARDVRPSRLERVKLGISNLIEKVAGDRLGLIAFSGGAFLQCPLTLDHQAFIKTINDLQVGLIKTPGTNLALPISEATRSFSKDDSDRFLILLSDGEDLEGEGLKRAKEASKDGIKIFTIGIGSDQGSRIPTDTKTNSNNFMLDRSGNPIISKKDAKALRAIAEATGGKYLPLGPTGEGLAEILAHLQSIGQQKKKEQLSSELPIERFQAFALLALILLFSNSLVTRRSGFGENAQVLLIFFLLMFGGCLKNDAVKEAELAIAQGNHLSAAKLYTDEINASRISEKPTDPKLFLNAGISFMEAGMMDEAEINLEQALDSSFNDPELQSLALNSLGNLYYRKTNFWLDRQNVNMARKTWERALEFYESAYNLDGNEKANRNFLSLQKQIEERINSLVCLIYGTIWWDRNGDGERQGHEPFLKGSVFWDKDGNGEHNKSNEPSLPTNEYGGFQFEWISSLYPSSFNLDSILDENSSTDQGIALVPIFPPPPPPFQENLVVNHLLSIDQAGKKVLSITYRKPPSISGKVWSDENGNGEYEENEKGISSAKIFLDRNENSKLDENETSYTPRGDGSFLLAIPPGRHLVAIEPENPDANVTFPIQERKGYFVQLDYEEMAGNLNFGIQDNHNQEKQDQPQDSPNDHPQQNDSSQNDESESDPEQKNEDESAGQEVNALYERLLQEMESKSKPLEQETHSSGNLSAGRDY